MRIEFNEMESVKVGKEFIARKLHPIDSKGDKVDLVTRMWCLLGWHYFEVPDTFKVIHEECRFCGKSRGVKYYSMKIGD